MKILPKSSNLKTNEVIKVNIDLSGVYSCLSPTVHDDEELLCTLDCVGVYDCLNLNE